MLLTEVQQLEAQIVKVGARQKSVHHPFGVTSKEEGFIANNNLSLRKAKDSLKYLTY
jgi:hypothetical protein